MADSLATYGEMQTQTALRLRIETQDILDRIEEYLSGKRKKVVNTEDGIKIIEDDSGVQVVNSEGVNGIIGVLTPIFSSAVVQGNWTEKDYKNNLSFLHEDLVEVIAHNREDWDMELRHVTPVITMVMTTMSGFLSRLIDNKERESYTAPVQYKETRDTVYAPSEKKRKGGGF